MPDSSACRKTGGVSHVSTRFFAVKSSVTWPETCRLDRHFAEYGMLLYWSVTMWLFPTPTLFIPFTNPCSLGRLIQRFLGPTRENKWSKIFDKRPPHMDGSIVLARLRQCATTADKCFLGPTRVCTSNGISIGSAVFARIAIVTDRPIDRPR